MKNPPFNFEDFTRFNLSPKVILWIYKNLKEGSTILELGSGKSSRELSKVYKVFSIEHSLKYINYKNVNYIYAPIKNGWYDITILKEKLPKIYNLIIVDGPPGWNPLLPGRSKFLDNLNLFLNNVTIIFDDYHRKKEKMLVNQVNYILKRETKIITDSNKKACILLL